MGTITAVVAWVTANWDIVGAVATGLLAVFWVIAKATKNTTDDKVATWLQRALGAIGLSRQGSTKDEGPKKEDPKDSFF